MTPAEADSLELRKLDAPQPTARPRYPDGRRFHEGDRVQMRTTLSPFLARKPLGAPRIITAGTVLNLASCRSFEVRVLLDDYPNAGTYFEEQFDHENVA